MFDTNSVAFKAIEAEMVKGLSFDEAVQAARVAVMDAYQRAATDPEYRREMMHRVYAAQRA